MQPTGQEQSSSGAANGGPTSSLSSQPDPLGSSSPQADCKPPPTLDKMLAKEVERTGLGAVDLSLLKILLMKKLIGKPTTHQQATSSLLGNMVCWQKLGANLEPKLTLESTNFPSWSAALCSLVDLITGSKDYFSLDRLTTNPTTSVDVMALI
jgi:hypothetical protein